MLLLLVISALQSQWFSVKNCPGSWLLLQLWQYLWKNVTKEVNSVLFSLLDSVAPVSTKTRPPKKSTLVYRWNLSCCKSRTLNVIRDPAQSLHTFTAPVRKTVPESKRRNKQINFRLRNCWSGTHHCTSRASLIVFVLNYYIHILCVFIVLVSWIPEKHNLIFAELCVDN